MFNIWFWRKLHCMMDMPGFGNQDEQRAIDAGYCLDRYFIEPKE